MKDLAALDKARRDGTIRQRLRNLVRRQEHDEYALRKLALLSPHLTKEEKAYCQQLEQQLKR